MQIGAAGYLTKGAGPDEMINAIRAVNSGQRYITPEIAQQMALSQFKSADENPFSSLSERELQIMLMITRGEKVPDISEQLVLSTKTINSYRYRMFEKLNVGNEWFELNPKAEKIWDKFWVDNPHFCNQEEEISTLGSLQGFFDIGLVLYSVYLLLVSPWWIPAIWIARFGIPMGWAFLTNTKEDWEKLGVTEDTPLFPKLW